MNDELVGQHKTFLDGYNEGYHDAEPKWINVEKEYPPEETPILCYLNYEENHDSEDGNKNERIRIQKIIVGVSKKNSCFIIGDNWQYFKIGCTHWMKLPSFPEDKNEKIT